MVILWLGLHDSGRPHFWGISAGNKGEKSDRRLLTPCHRRFVVHTESRFSTFAHLFLIFIYLFIFPFCIIRVLAQLGS
jgi:hypothetical protein